MLELKGMKTADCEAKPIGIRWTSTGPELEPPAMPGDVGTNLPSLEDVVIPARSYAELWSGVCIELPKGIWAMIVPRSSANRSGKLIVCAGVIDTGYRGPLAACVHNVSDEPVTIEAGKSVAQLVFYSSIVPVSLHRVEQLSDSARGANGFGSTGNGVNGHA